MRQVRDTFLHFIADNLSSYYSTAIPVVGLFRTPTNPNGDTLQQNAVNIGFLQSNMDPVLSVQTAEIDVINDDELVAVDWSSSLWQLLSATFYAPLLDYTVPSAPAAQGTNIMWSLNGVNFKPIHSNYYFRYNCRLAISSHS